MSHGLDAVHELILEEGWEYPVSVKRLENAHPLANLELSRRGDTILLAELLGKCDADRFESREDLQEKLEPVIEKEIKSRNRGLFGRFKKYLSRVLNE